MSIKVSCEKLTRHGRPCRNLALLGSNPPRCARHRQQQPATTPPEPPLATQLFLPGLSPDELEVLDEHDTANLQRELREVRLTMYRLLKLWREQDGPLEPEEARRLAALIFTGARTVAHLLSQSAKATDDARDWLAQALDRLAAEQGLDV